MSYALYSLAQVKYFHSQKNIICITNGCNLRTEIVGDIQLVIISYSRHLAPSRFCIVTGSHRSSNSMTLDTHSLLLFQKCKSKNPASSEDEIYALADVRAMCSLIQILNSLNSF